MHRHKRRRVTPYSKPLLAATGLNRFWCADFKGRFRTGDGTRIDPLTMMDAYSLYLLRVQAVKKTDPTWPGLKFTRSPCCGRSTN